MKRFFIIYIMLCLYICGTDCSAKVFKKFEPQNRFEDVKNQDNEMSLSEYATFAYGENNLKEAMDYILKIKPFDRTAQNWLLLGNILQENNKIADAIFMYNKAILVDKTFYKSYYNLANIYFDQSKFNLAIKNYKLAVRFNSKFAYAHYNMGCAYLELGQLKKAKTEFIRAIEIKNTVPDFHYNLAYVYKRLNKENLSKQYLDNYNKLIFEQ